MRNLIGCHVLDGPHTGPFLDMVGRLYDNGTPVPIVNVVNDWDIVHEIYRRSPATKLFARLENGNNPHIGENGADYLNARLPALAPVLNIATVQIANEHNGDNPKFLSDFYCQMMQRAKAIGVRCTVGDLAVGNPGGDMVAAQQALSPMLQMAQDLGFVLLVHMYGDQFDQANLSTNAQYFFLRWTAWLKSFPQLKVVGGEGGPFDARFVSVDRTMSLIQQENNLLQPYINNVLGLCQWTVGGTEADGWAKSSIDSVFDQYEAYLKGFPKMGGATIPSQPSSPTLGEADFIAYSADKGKKPDDLVVVEYVGPNEPEFMFPANVIIKGEDDVPPAPVPPPVPDTALVAVLAVVLNVRSAPDPKANNIIGKLAKDTRITIIVADDTTRAKNNGYVQIAGQVNHWVAYQYLEPVAS